MEQLQIVIEDKNIDLSSLHTYHTHIWSRNVDEIFKARKKRLNGFHMLCLRKIMKTK
jgi:hypothetical protein